MTALLVFVLAATHARPAHKAAPAKTDPAPTAKPSPAVPQPACKHSPKLVGSCFKVHGWLELGEGLPPVRISQGGSNKVLAVEDATPGKADDPWLPPEVRSAVDSEHSAEADFFVCPLTEAREGDKQVVCIDSASKVKRRSL
jgi:hypothetical protein